MYLLLLAILALAAPAVLPAQERGAPALGSLLEGLGVSDRVLVIGAHPDDEDTRLITWLTRGHHAEVAYLSLTRGDGGQNLIGNELGEALGVIRTEELLAARRIDGAHQYFSRAYDFGFSKTAAETFEHWPHDSVLKDVVTVVRAFRPHVIVSVFSGTPADGHGNHQVAGIVAREAYDAAMDTVRFPRAATAGLGPWTPLKFYRVRTYWGNTNATFTYDAGQYDPLLGASYAQIASESRSQHKSQGFGMLEPKGYVEGSLRREGSRVAAPSDASAERSIFDGIDTSWHRLDSLVTHPASRAALARLAQASAEALRATSLYHPATGLPALAQVRDALAELEAAEVDSVRRPDPDVAASLHDGVSRATRALLLARGIAIDAEVDRDVVALGDSIPVKVTVYDRGTTTVRARVDGDAHDVTPLGSSPARAGASIAPDSARTFTVMVHGDSLTQPWWLVTPRHGDLFSVPIDGRMDDVRDAGPSVRVALDDGRLVTMVPIVHRYADPVLGEQRRPLAVVPVISVELDRTTELARADAPLSRDVRVTLRSGVTEARSATVELRLPSGLSADSATRTVTLAPLGATTVTFTVHGALRPGAHEIAVVARSGGRTYDRGYTLIDYPHIRPQELYHDARVSVQAVNVKLPPRLRVAYVPGVGDNVASMLRELGVPLTIIDPAKLAATDLSPYTTVVLGPRAYASHPELAADNPKLFRWVRGGGTLVVQYGQYEMARPGMMPYPITLSRPAARVTDENAAVRVLDPASPLLTTPNRITADDWRGWVQERSLYMPSTFDAHYHPVLSMHDPGEAPNDAAILVAPMGKGEYVYTTLSLFRQLPAANAGASRLFVNLLAPRGTAAGSAR